MPLIIHFTNFNWI